MNRKKLYICLFVLTIIFSILRSEETSSRPRIGLALSGGGAKGLAHIGVLKVLEELDIKIDYIAGTSMGSIVGGLYAVGYRSQELEKLVLEQDWDDLLLDKISRRNISLEEKRNQNKYAGSFPIRNTGIELPEGLVAGQKIQSLLTYHTLPVHHIEEFDQLPTPFVCLATDIEKGKAVVLDHGFLPDAIRASMSIPSAFSPIEIEGQLLVDGGLVRNFPVSDVINMGADIVIGVDVGTPLYSKKDLYSLDKILTQSISLLAAESTLEERQLADILIEPQVEDYTLLDFSEPDSLIARGERAARKLYPVLQTLATSLKKFGTEADFRPLTHFDSLYINKIYIQGLREVSQKLVKGNLQLRENHWINPHELSSAMERLYGTGFFKRATYKLEPVPEGVNLFIRLVEQTSNYFKFGLHYDSDRKSSVLLNLTYRNLLIEGSKFSFDYNLGENTAYELSYLIHTGWRPGFLFGFRQLHDNFKVSLYENDELFAEYDYTSDRSRLELQTIFSHSVGLGGAFEVENSEISPLLIPIYIDDEVLKTDLINLIGFLNIDTLNRSDYPQYGVKLFAEISRSYEIADQEVRHDPITSYILKYKEILQISKRISLLGGLKLGYILGKEIPSDSFFYLGGLQETEDNLFTFTGYNFMAIYGKAAAVFESSIQFEPWDGKFITATANYARTGWYFKDLYEKVNYYYGFGLTAGILTPIGPIEYTAMVGDNQKEVISYISIGYNF